MEDNQRYALDIIQGMADRTIKRLWYVVLALILVIALETGVFVWYLSQYDFYDYSEEVTQDGQGLNIIGDRNGVMFDGSALSQDGEGAGG